MRDVILTPSIALDLTNDSCNRAFLAYKRREQIMSDADAIGRLGLPQSAHRWLQKKRNWTMEGAALLAAGLQMPVAEMLNLPESAA